MTPLSFAASTSSALGRAGALAVLLALAGTASAQVVFQAPVTSMPCELARSLALGDVDGDGRLDAITGSANPGIQPALSRGQGGGHFAAPVALTSFFGGARVLRLADFDEDGHLDALAGNSDAGSSNFTVHLGDGRGGFGPPTGVALAGELPGSADVGDFDGDGHLDLAIANRPTFQQAASVLVLLGTGDGGFGPQLPVHTLTSADMLTFSPRLLAGDTDGDGLDDIVLAGVTAAHGVLRSLGSGRFAPVACAGGCATTLSASELADFNGDGRMDLLSPQAVLLGQPDGGLQAAGSLPLGGNPTCATAGDFDGDGALDVALGRSGGIVIPVSSTAFVRGNGDGSFASTEVVVSNVAGSELSAAAGDLDDDGRQDVIVLGGGATTGSSRLNALLNHTYPAGSPFTDLGGQLQGLGGYPIQLASGTLIAGQPFSFKLANVISGQQAWHVVGFTQLNAPFKGGTMVPHPVLLSGPFAANSSGVLNLAGNWPAGGSGLSLYLQFWCPNFLGFGTFSASSGVRAQIP